MMFSLLKNIRHNATKSLSEFCSDRFTKQSVESNLQYEHEPLNFDFSNEIYHATTSMFCAGNPKFVLTGIPVSLESSSQRDRIVSSLKEYPTKASFIFFLSVRRFI